MENSVVEQDFLARIREVEQQATDLVSQARENARLAQEDACAKAAGIVNQAHDDSAREKLLILAEAENKAGQMTLQAQMKASAAAAALKKASSGKIAEAVRQVAERIVNGNADR
jgi:vacuolar-type H+-ATPase subunit H